MKPHLDVEHPRCMPMRNLLGTIGSKWAMLIIALLKNGPKRFSELKREIGGITQKSLTAVLRELEANGIVSRTVTPSIPPRVDYELTEIGKSLLGPINALGDWAAENEAKVAEARERFRRDNGKAAANATS